MIKCEITNELTGFKGQNTNTQENIEAWKADVLGRSPYGKPERWIDTSEMPADLIGREVLDESGLPTTRIVDAGTDENGDLVQKEQTLVKADYVIVETDITTQVQREKRLQDFKAKTSQGLKRAAANREICLAIIDRIAEHNETLNLTKQDKNTLESTYAGIQKALTQSFRPGLAKQLIDAVTPDGTLVTTELKAELSGILADHLTEYYS